MWKYCEIYCVIITIYIKGKKKYKRKTEKKKKKMAHKNETVDEQWKNTEWILLKYCSSIADFHKTNIFSCGWS